MSSRGLQDAGRLQFFLQSLSHFLDAIFLVEGGADLQGVIDEINRRRMTEIKGTIRLVQNGALCSEGPGSGEIGIEQRLPFSGQVMHLDIIAQLPRIISIHVQADKEW